ncbi:MAG: H-NS histone family protein [Rubrivivax sp.]
MDTARRACGRGIALIYSRHSTTTGVTVMSNLSDLLAKRVALEQQIVEAQRSQKAEAIAQIRALMAEHGLSMADLGLRAGAAPPRKMAVAKVPPKYRHPSTGDTWSGRGLQPNWLKAALNDGARLDDFKL